VCKLLWKKSWMILFDNKMIISLISHSHFLSIQHLIFNCTLPRFTRPLSTNAKAQILWILPKLRSLTSFAHQFFSLWTTFMISVISWYTSFHSIHVRNLEFAIPRSQFRICNSSFAIPNLQFLVRNSEFAIPHSQFRICNSSFAIQNSQFRICNSSFTIPNSYFSILHSEFRIPGS
jgi:hypothetical protein